MNWLNNEVNPGSLKTFLLLISGRVIIFESYGSRLRNVIDVKSLLQSTDNILDNDKLTAAGVNEKGEMRLQRNSDRV